MILFGSLLSACETTNEDEPTVDGGIVVDAGPPPAVAAEVALELQPIKIFHFTWTDVADATHYKLLESADGASEFIQVGNDVAASKQSIDHIVPLHARVNAKYILQSCNTNACIDSASVEVTGSLQEAIGYVKASNTDEEDWFATSVALSADGNTLAVGAHGEASSGLGIDTGEADDSADKAGAVYVFTRMGGSWSQQAYVKASNTDAGDSFGSFVALSGDGNTLPWGLVLKIAAASAWGRPMIQRVKLARCMCSVAWVAAGAIVSLPAKREKLLKT